MWDPIANIEPVRPASLAASPVPRLRGATIGPLAGNSGTPALAGGAAADTLAAAPDAAAMPVPRLRSDVVSRRPVVGTGVRNFASDVAAGMTAPGGDSPISAFAVGFAGAINSQNERGYREAKALLDAQDRQIAADTLAYERGRDVKEDERADLELKAKIDSGYFKKAANTTDYVDETGELTPYGKFKIEDMVTEERNNLLDFYQQSGFAKRANAQQVEADLDARMVKYRERLEEAARSGQPTLVVPTPREDAETEADADISGDSGTPAPAPAVPRVVPTPTAPAAPPAPPAGYTGAGTPDSPYAGGTAPPPNLKPGQVWLAPDGVTLVGPE